MWVWLVIMVCLFALPVILQGVLLFIVAPILIHQKQTLPLRPEYGETQLEDLTPEMRDFLSQTLREFRADGFDVAANIHHPNTMKGMDSFQILLVNRPTGDLGSAIMVHSSTARALTFSVTSRFADGTALSTVSSRNLTAFPRDPKVSGINFPWVTSPAAIIEAHRRRLKASGRNAETRVAPRAG